MQEESLSKILHNRLPQLVVMVMWRRRGTTRV